MNEVVMACAIGTVIGIVLFFILALTGYIDKWTAQLIRLSERRRGDALSGE
jgi:hypothetical protein